MPGVPAGSTVPARVFGSRGFARWGCLPARSCKPPGRARRGPFARAGFRGSAHEGLLGEELPAGLLAGVHRVAGAREGAPARAAWPRGSARRGLRASGCRGCPGLPVRTGPPRPARQRSPAGFCPGRLARGLPRRGLHPSGPRCRSLPASRFCPRTVCPRGSAGWGVLAEVCPARCARPGSANSGAPALVCPPWPPRENLLSRARMDLLATGGPLQGLLGRVCP